MKDYSVLDGMTRNMKDCLITAYNKGYSRGYDDGWAVHKEIRQKDMDMGYEQGLEDAWECLRKIFNDIPESDTLNIFHENSFRLVFQNHTAQDAMAKIKECEERQKGFEKCSECKYKDADFCKTGPLHEEDEDGNCLDFVPEKIEKPCDVCAHNKYGICVQPKKKPCRNYSLWEMRKESNE